MKKMVSIIGILLCSFYFISESFAEGLKSINLPAPQKVSGKPLMQALNERQSQRAFSSEELPLQELSNLLWAANGVNRPDGRRTAPSAHDAREIDIYVAKKEGLYLYHAEKHELVPVFSGDIRAKTGKQGFVKDAPVVLVFAADLRKLGRDSEEDAVFYGTVDAGFVSQNVYLYCASAGLATVVLNWVDKEKLAQAMKLRRAQRVILTQPVGYLEK